MIAKARVIKVIKKKHILFGTIRFYNGYAFLQDIARALNYRSNNEYYDLIKPNAFFEGKYHLIDDEGIYVKIAVLRQIYLYDGISETTCNYVISKCENDSCYVVRKTCEEIKPK